MAKAYVDFSLAPDLSWGHLIRALNADLEVRLASLPETLDRAKGAFWFSHLLDGNKWSLKQRESYLRAGLAEFVSMEDTLPRDLERAGITALARKIWEFPEPVLHIVHHLRNLELHLQTSPMKSGQITATAGKHTLDLTTWYVQDLNFDCVKASLRNARRYSDTDLRELIDWFNQAQKVWGVDEILRRAVITYASRIVDEYNL